MLGRLIGKEWTGSSWPAIRSSSSRNKYPVTATDEMMDRRSVQFVSNIAAAECRSCTVKIRHLPSIDGQISVIWKFHGKPQIMPAIGAVTRVVYVWIIPCNFATLRD